ncbi:TPA: hypothetical protein MH639_20690 [Klebsiella pneumoniae]|nr:hypothetical protein [Klebsiella pneumoniae]
MASLRRSTLILTFPSGLRKRGWTASFSRAPLLSDFLGCRGIDQRRELGYKKTLMVVIWSGG